MQNFQGLGIIPESCFAKRNFMQISSTSTRFHLNSVGGVGAREKTVFERLKLSDRKTNLMKTDLK